MAETLCNFLVNCEDLAAETRFTQLLRRHQDNRQGGVDNSNEKNGSGYLFDNTLRQQLQAKINGMTTARSPEPTSSLRSVPGDFYARKSVWMT